MRLIWATLLSLNIHVVVDILVDWSIRDVRRGIVSQRRK